MGTSTTFSRWPSRKREMYGGRDCSGPLRPINLALQPWPSTIKIAQYASHPWPPYNSLFLEGSLEMIR